jgi:Capsid protein VP4/Phospholipase A2-like domain
MGRDLPVDSTADELKELLGTTRLSKDFIEWYRQDWSGSGYTIPFMKYSGPGNPTNIGDPVNEADKFAKIHDLEYAHASFKFQKGHINRQQFEKRISKADTKFLTSNGVNVTSSMHPGEQIASIIGGTGIGGKKIIESIVGQQYPNTDPSKAFTKTPIQSSSLANNLMKNLQNNIQSRNNSETNNTPMEADSTTGNKRVSSEPITHGGKATPAQSGGESLSSEMNLPGTGGIGAGTGPEEEITYERSHWSHGPRGNYFKAVHNFYSFGLGVNQIQKDFTAPTENQLFRTTSLAAIPWEYPFSYMTPADFEALDPNTKVKKVKATIRHIITRQAFETSSTSTTLATLNQISRISTAVGLNKTSWGNNIHFTSFDNTNPMVPMDLSEPIGFARYPSLMWGSDNATLALDEGASLEGRWIELQDYFSLITSKQQKGGLPKYRSKVITKNGHTTKDKHILTEEYQPIEGWLKSPYQTNRWGLPQAISGTQLQVAVNQNILNCNLVNVGATGASNTIIATTNNSQTPNNIQGASWDEMFAYDTPIEKSQYLKTGIWGQMQHCKVQPSLHVGIEAVPSITTTAGPDIPTHYVDTQGYYEVVLEMWTEQHEEFPFSNLSTATVPFGEAVVRFNPAGPEINSCTLGGLYPNQRIRS